jgi:hypothetical protein
MMFLALQARDLGKSNIYLEINNFLLLQRVKDPRTKMTSPRGKLAVLAFPPEQTVK